MSKLIEASGHAVSIEVVPGTGRSARPVDILIDLTDGVGVVGLVGLERELSEILERPVDVVPAARLRPAVAQRVANEAIAL